MRRQWLFNGLKRPTDRGSKRAGKERVQYALNAVGYSMPTGFRLCK